MLVLTRKIDEQIVIGNDIKITLIRVRGNTVRLGIEAPRDVRIVRSELELSEETPSEPDQDIAEREGAFAHPRTKVTTPNKRKASNRSRVHDRLTAKPESKRRPTNRMRSALAPSVFVGKVARDGSDPELNRAPLAAFTSAG
jgi:carbon storage regulator CsrA